MAETDNFHQPATTATSAATFLDSTHVSVFDGSTNVQPVETASLETILQRIQSGTYQAHVEQLRHVLTTQGKKAYNRAKRQSTAFTPAGIFSKRANAKLTTPSGLLNFDFDNLSDVAAAKALVINDPWIVYTFISPSGDGLKFAVWADGIVDDATYKHAWGTVLAYFQKTYPDLAIANDKQCCDISRLCYMSFDPNLHANPNALLYAVPRCQPPAAKPKPKPAGQRTSAVMGHSMDEQGRVEAALQHIPADDRTVWLDMGMALHASGEPWARAVWDTWSQTSTKYDAQEQERVWHSFKADGGLTLATLFHEAKQYGYVPLTTATMHVGSSNGHAASSTPPAASTRTPAAATSVTWGASQINWKSTLNVTRGGEPKETFNNLALALENLAPWNTESWYDVVRDRGMVGQYPLDDGQIRGAARAIEQQSAIPIRNLKLVASALRGQCDTKKRDLLQEWLSSLPPWDGVERLTEWLCDHAGAVKTAYVMDVSRLFLVSMVARALKPGCQCRAVIILEGRENIGKSKLVETLASPEWYRDVSGSLEGKEAHIILKGTWVVELSELSSLGRTEDARLKSFITMANDEYVPKYANDPIKRERRTILVGTHNPEGDRSYLRSQTGNTRFYPVEVADINLEDVQLSRDQLFAEALNYYEQHPTDWWQLSAEGERLATEEREHRRQRGAYEDSLANWLEQKAYTIVWWELIAEEFLTLPKERWSDRRPQMEVAKSLGALGWRKQSRQRLLHQGKDIRVHPWGK